MVRAGHPVHRDDRARDLFLAHYQGLRDACERAVADAAVRRIRLCRARHGLQPDFRWHRPQRRRDFRALQFRRAVLSVCARPAGLAGGGRHLADRRRHWCRQRHLDWLPESATVPHDARDADHSARLRQFVERALRHGVRDQFGRERGLGFSRRRFHSRSAGQRRRSDRRTRCRPYLSQPLPLRLASHRHRRQPQSRPACRHSRQPHAAGDLYSVGRSLRRRRSFLRGTPRQHGTRQPASGGNSRP